MSSVETGQMCAVETGQMSAAETGQMSAVDTGQMSIMESRFALSQYYTSRPAPVQSSAETRYMFSVETGQILFCCQTWVMHGPMQTFVGHCRGSSRPGFGVCCGDRIDVFC